MYELVAAFAETEAVARAGDRVGLGQPAVVPQALDRNPTVGQQTRRVELQVVCVELEALQEDV